MGIRAVIDFRLGSILIPPKAFRPINFLCRDPRDFNGVRIPCAGRTV